MDAAGRGGGDGRREGAGVGASDGAGCGARDGCDDLPASDESSHHERERESQALCQRILGDPCLFSFFFNNAGKRTARPRVPRRAWARDVATARGSARARDAARARQSAGARRWAERRGAARRGSRPKRRRPAPPHQSSPPDSRRGFLRSNNLSVGLKDTRESVLKKRHGTRASRWITVQSDKSDWTRPRYESRLKRKIANVGTLETTECPHSLSRPPEFR